MVAQDDEPVVVVGQDDVGVAITVDIADRQPVRVVVRGVRDRIEHFGGEGPVRQLAVDASFVPTTVERDDICPAIEVDIGDLHWLGDVVARGAGRSGQGPSSGLEEDADVGGRRVAAVARHDVIAAIAVDIADPDAVRVLVCADAILGSRAEPAARQLRDNADIRGGIRLSRHDDEIVTPVAGDVGDLKVVVARVLRRVDGRDAETADTVAEQDGHGVRTPADAGDVEVCIAVEVPEADPIAVRRRRHCRSTESSGGILREDLDAEASDTEHDVRATVTGHVADRDRFGPVGVGRASRV